MIELVPEDRGALSGKRPDQAEIRHVAGRENERPLAPGIGREFLLERSVFCLMTGDQVRGACADAVEARGSNEGFDDFWMRGEAEVVVAAEIDTKLAVELDVRGSGRATAYGAPLPLQVACLEFREQRPQRQGFGGHDQLVTAAGSGRIPSRPNNA